MLQFAALSVVLVGPLALHLHIGKKVLAVAVFQCTEQTHGDDRRVAGWLKQLCTDSVREAANTAHVFFFFFHICTVHHQHINILLSNLCTII